MFYKGAQLKLGEVAQRSIDSTKTEATSPSVPTMMDVVTVGLNAAAYASSVNGFMSGLHQKSVKPRRSGLGGRARPAKRACQSGVRCCSMY